MSVDVLPVVPAGKIALPKNAAEGEDWELRLLHGEAETASEVPLHELSRRYSLDGNLDHAVMPEGKTLAAIWDRRHETYLALSRPFLVERERTTEAPLEKPAADAAFLVVNVYRPPGALSGSVRDLNLFLEQGRVEHPADEMILNAWGAYAFWYDLRPGIVTLKGGNDMLYLDPRHLELHGGSISRVVQQLSPRPFLGEQ